MLWVMYFEPPVLLGRGKAKWHRVTNYKIALRTPNCSIAIKFTYKLTYMTIFFTRLKVGYPGPQKALEDFPDSWKVYTICTNQYTGSSTTIADVKAMEEADKLQARSAYLTLLGKAQTGQPLDVLYDTKRCHDVYTFDFNNAPSTIYRIRAGDVRIYFCYLPPSKTIVLLKTKPKHKNELNKSEKNELETIARSVLQYSNPTHFESRVI